MLARYSYKLEESILRMNIMIIIFTYTSPFLISFNQYSSRATNIQYFLYQGPLLLMLN